jgi:hypothetical protein
MSENDLPDSSVSSSPELAVGDRVNLSSAPPYLKTADPMPMLRPPDLVQVGEEGVVLDYRPGALWSVKFNRGVFLIDGKYLERMSDQPSDGTSVEASI